MEETDVVPWRLELDLFCVCAPGWDIMSMKCLFVC